ncbi:MAG: class I SAM-dependent methyltransferase [Thermodesulfobacteriota bacterium]
MARSYLTLEKNCRICNGNDLLTILDLGLQPLANNLIPETKFNERVDKYPLTLVKCNRCGLLQIRETISPEVLFSNYMYLSSCADTLVSGADNLANQLIEKYRLGKSDLVVEIASNDGYLLQFYQKAGIPVLGIEPAANVAKIAQEKRNIRTVVEFFGEELAKRIRQRYKAPSVIHANNVLAHVANLHEFVGGMKILLSPSGVISVEAAYVKYMIDVGAFDLIYHEHLCYYSLRCLNLLFKKHNLEIFDVQYIPAQGGSLRIFAGHPSEHEKTDRLNDFQEKEQQEGIGKDQFYTEFANRVMKLKKDLCSMLEQLKNEGKKIIAYGAAAKATVLFNYFGLGSETFEYVVDRNQQKQGYIIPGTNLKIYPVEQIEIDKPDIILLTAWNYADEIISQLTSHRNRGGEFIIPLPYLKLLH